MFPGRKIIFFTMMFFLGLTQPLRAQEQTTINQSVKTQKPLKTFSSFDIGVSYLMWNESLKISQSANTAIGFANYAGFGFDLQQSWTTGRWVRGGALSYAFGKASSGGFDSIPTFADGVNRSWWAAQGTGFGYYRINVNFMAGLGLFVRQRVADWKPKDQNVTADAEQNTKIGGEFLFKWRLSPSISLMQTFAPLNLDGSTLWTWTALISL